MHHWTILLGISAAIFQTAAYFLYAVIGTSSSRSTSWLISAFVMTLNAVTFYKMTGNAFVTLQFFAGSVACIVIFVYMCTQERLSAPQTSEWIALTLGSVAILVWMTTGNAAWANIVVFLALAISFRSTSLGSIENSDETPHPWILWMVAFIITAVAILANQNHLTNPSLSFVTPIGCAMLYATIAILSSDWAKSQLDGTYGEDEQEKVS